MDNGEGGLSDTFGGYARQLAPDESYRLGF